MKTIALGAAALFATGALFAAGSKAHAQSASDARMELAAGVAEARALNADLAAISASVGRLAVATAGVGSEAVAVQRRRRREEETEPTNAEIQIANLSVRISQIEQELQRITGDMEELSYRVDTTTSRLDALNQAITAGAFTAGPAPEGFGRPATGPTSLSDDAPFVFGAAPADDGVRAQPVDDFGQPAGPAPGDAPAPDPIGPARADLPTDPDDAYGYAYRFLLQGDYQRAEGAFESFLDAFPTHEKSADARFRLGEIYLATGAYADAADMFLTHVQSYPDDPRAAESYLKLGTSLARLGREGEACQVFGTLRRRYPNASSAVLQRLQAERDRTGC